MSAAPFESNKHRTGMFHRSAGLHSGGVARLQVGDTHVPFVRERDAATLRRAAETDELALVREPLNRQPWQVVPRTERCRSARVQVVADSQILRRQSTARCGA